MILSDPHEPLHEWRAVNGIRQVRYSSPGFRTSCWYTMHDAHHMIYLYNEPIPALFTHTPERLALWAELVLNPTL